jgi:DNA-directed RNA polymerase subunit RPC12/RpoP
MNKSGYAIECTECGSREIKKSEPKNSITVKTMSEVTFRILECKNCGYKERENIN